VGQRAHERGYAVNLYWAPITWSNRSNVQRCTM